MKKIDVDGVLKEARERGSAQAWSPLGYGAGSIGVRAGKYRAAWYWKGKIDGRQVMIRLSPIQTREGRVTQTQAVQLIYPKRVEWEVQHARQAEYADIVALLRSSNSGATTSPIDRPNFKNLYEQYIKFKTIHKVSKSHLDNMKLVLRYHEDIHFLPIVDLRFHHVETIHNYLVENKPGMAAISKAILTGWFNWLSKNKRINIENFGSQLQGVKIQPKERFLNAAEIKFILERPYKNTKLNDYQLSILLTGQRPGEVFQATLDEIDQQKKVWTIPGEKRKNRKRQIVPLSNLAMKHLLKFIQSKGALNSSTGLNTALHKWFSQYSIKEKWTFHDLRRTCATQMAILGTPQQDVSRVLGHNYGTTVTHVYQRYNRLEEARVALDQLAKWVEYLVNYEAQEKDSHLQEILSDPDIV